MRRLLSILLVAILGCVTAAPLFADTSAVPICCRKNGVHECGMVGMGDFAGAALQETKIGAVHMKCPMFPKATAQAHIDVAVTTAEAVFAGLVQHPAVQAQTEAQYRISSERARQKRGPPAATVTL